MLDMKWKRLGTVASLSLVFLVAGCGQNSGEIENENASNSAQMEYTITGIEPGAGITQRTDEAFAAYENLSGWEQDLSSTGAMLSVVDTAIKNEEPVVFTAWTPHYMFAKWDLKMLEDPEGTFGGEEYAATIVKTGLAEEKPEAYEILDRIYLEVSDIEAALLVALEEDLTMEEVAQRWVDENPDTVAEWTEGVAPVSGASLELVTTPWDADLFVAYIAVAAFEQHGYDVTLTPVDPAIVFQSVATGSADASLSPWMPTTHGDLYAEYEADFEDLGPAYEGAKLGLAVPTYMEENSIADFEPAP